MKGLRSSLTLLFVLLVFFGPLLSLGAFNGFQGFLIPTIVVLIYYFGVTLPIFGTELNFFSKFLLTILFLWVIPTLGFHLFYTSRKWDSACDNPANEATCLSSLAVRKKDPKICEKIKIHNSPECNTAIKTSSGDWVTCRYRTATQENCMEDVKDKIHNDALGRPLGKFFNKILDPWGN